jgi:hypothetical protein
MVSIPPILLKKLYVPNSLQNRGEGFVFQIRNQIAQGTLVGLSRLIVNGEERSLDGVSIAANGETRSFAEVSGDSPMVFEVGEAVTIYVPGTLTAGACAIEITVNTREIGPLTFQVADQVRP